MFDNQAKMHTSSSNAGLAAPDREITPADAVFQQLEQLSRGMSELQSRMEAKLEGVRLQHTYTNSQEVVCDLPCEMPHVFRTQYEQCQTLKSQLSALFEYLGGVRI